LPEKMQKDSASLLNGTDLTKKPEKNELEVSVFGPGYGESILLHTGANKWIIVDSCIFPGDDYPAPLLYLDKLNIDYDAVKAIVVTHWHDDHIRGISTIFEKCKNAEFICSDAVKDKEFLNMVKIYGNCPIAEDSGIKEFHDILEEMKKRKGKGKANYSPKFAIEGRHLWKSTFKTNDGDNIKANLYSLSPCDEAILSAKLELTKYLPEKNTRPKAIPSISTNHASVVLWLSFNDVCILLGSDLEEEGNPYKGWSIIVNSPTRPKGKAKYYKIAHHGSINAHHPTIWKDMLEYDPVAVLTPFSKGNKLPTTEGIEKICLNTSKAFITGNPTSNKKLKRNSVVEKTIRESMGKIKMISPSYGHVRFRTNLQKECPIELFGDSTALCES
jgi:hypothetical protein